MIRLLAVLALLAGCSFTELAPPAQTYACQCTYQCGAGPDDETFKSVPFHWCAFPEQAADAGAKMEASCLRQLTPLCGNVEADPACACSCREIAPACGASR